MDRSRQISREKLAQLCGANVAWMRQRRHSHSQLFTLVGAAAARLFFVFVRISHSQCDRLIVLGLCWVLHNRWETNSDNATKRLWTAALWPKS